MVDLNLPQPVRSVGLPVIVNDFMMIAAKQYQIIEAMAFAGRLFGVISGAARVSGVDMTDFAEQHTVRNNRRRTSRERATIARESKEALDIGCSWTRSIGRGDANYSEIRESIRPV